MGHGAFLTGRVRTRGFFDETSEDTGPFDGTSEDTGPF